jgi:ankyrin repeat protein
MNPLKVILFSLFFFQFSLNALPPDADQKNGTSLELTGKKQLKEHLIDACNLNEEKKITCFFFFRTDDKPTKLVKECINQFTLPKGTPPSKTLSMFIDSPSGQRLHRKAAAKDLWPIESMMRNKGVDINAQSQKSGNTPLISAALANNWKMVDSLLKDAPPKSVAVKGKKGRHLLDIFFCREVQKLTGDTFFTTLLSKILKNGRGHGSPDPETESYINNAFILIATLADDNLLNIASRSIPNDQYHPLKNPKTGETIFINTARGKPEKPKLISYLLQLKNKKGDPLFDPNKESSNGLTPLMIASSYGNVDTVKAMLNDRRIKDKINRMNGQRRGEWSAFTYAQYNGYNRTMEILHENGATPNYASISKREVQLQRELQEARRTAGSSFATGLVLGGVAGFVSGGGFGG